MYNEPPVVRPPLAPPVQENPFSSPIVVNTAKPALYVKKKSSDAWAWKTIVIALFLSPVIWAASCFLLYGYYQKNFKDNLRSGVSGYVAVRGGYISEEGFTPQSQVNSYMFWSAARNALFWVFVVESVVCIPLGIFYVIRR